MLTPSKQLTLIALCAGTLALAACSDKDANKTVGQKLDSAVAESKAQANEAKEAVKEAATDAKVAVKDAAAEAQSKAKEAGASIEKKLDSAGQAVDDTAITAGVKAKLIAADDLKSLDIQVTTRQGEVTLEGMAPTAAARDSATRIAQGVDGVKAVHNKLRVGA